MQSVWDFQVRFELEFTPLEFETVASRIMYRGLKAIRIYSVGV